MAPISRRSLPSTMVLAYATDRFADQRWLLYDLKRSYGYYYDLREATEVRFKEPEGHL